MLPPPYPGYQGRQVQIQNNGYEGRNVAPAVSSSTAIISSPDEWLIIGDETSSRTDKNRKVETDALIQILPVHSDQDQESTGRKGAISIAK